MRSGWWIATTLVALSTATAAPAPEERRAVPVPEQVPGWLVDGHVAEAFDAWAAVDRGQHPSPTANDIAFVQAWIGVRADRADEVAKLLPHVADAPTPPAPYRDLLVAELHQARKASLAALKRLDAIPADHVVAPRAQAVRAAVLRDLGRTAEAAKVLEDLASARDPAPGVAHALHALVVARDPANPASLPLLWRLWRAYPTTEEGRAAAAWLREHHEGTEPGLLDALERVDRLMDVGAYDDAIALAASLRDEVPPTTERGCRLAYAHGRSLYKRNRLSDAMAAFGDAGRSCATVEDGEGEKILYLTALSAFRRGRFTQSAGLYADLATLYPHTTFADDGLTRAGIAWLEAGDEDAALASWRQALASFPAGDTVPEAAFRLAFHQFEHGHTDEAIQIATTLGERPVADDEVHVPAARYWAARWTGWPDAKRPDWLDPEGRPAATEALRAATANPHGWYAALAWARLHALDPAGAEQLAAEVRARLDAMPVRDGWTVRASLREDPRVVEAQALARLGLPIETRAAWSHLDPETFTPDEVAWWTLWRQTAGDTTSALEDIQRWLRAHPLDPFAPGTREVVRVGYPDRYGDVLRSVHAKEGWTWDHRFQHGLVREESGFDRYVISYAGAYGLGQLMPATANDVAGRIGMTISRQDLYDPATNLRISGAYLTSLLERYGMNPALTLAAYNAGPGRVGGWLAERGDQPLDAFVERIPIRQTRGYVKRVSATWQTYRTFDEGPAFIDLRPWTDSVSATLTR